MGEAFAAYLKYARVNEAGIRHVFVRTTAPHAGLSIEAVGSCAAPVFVADWSLLGHTVCGMRWPATWRVSVPGSSRSIGFCGHRDTTSTSIHARVDINQLRALAQPLPDRSL